MTSGCLTQCTLQLYNSYMVFIPPLSVVSNLTPCFRFMFFYYVLSQCIGLIQHNKLQPCICGQSISALQPGTSIACSAIFLNIFFLKTYGQNMEKAMMKCLHLYGGAEMRCQWEPAGNWYGPF